jgi:hypothetical protein
MEDTTHPHTIFPRFKKMTKGEKKRVESENLDSNLPNF